MRIVAISDLHGDLIDDPRLPLGRVLVIAGDSLPDDYRMPGRDETGTTRITRQGWWFDSVFVPWLRYQTTRYADIILIGGNHDYFFQSVIGLQNLLPPRVHWLRESSVSIDGVNFYGAPWNGTRGWAFCIDEEGMYIKLGAVPDDTDVLVTHGPPFAPEYEELEYYTSAALGMWIRGRTNLKAVICGHVHEAYGRYDFGTVPVHVVASKDRRYCLVNAPVVIDLAVNSTASETKGETIETPEPV